VSGDLRALHAVRWDTVASYGRDVHERWLLSHCISVRRLHW
jgi:hypothetical protein